MSDMMRYVSNAGIVLKQDKTGIGIDCFCRDSNHLYQDTPDEVCRELLEEIQEGQLQALIFTHEHSDHFCADHVKEACGRNADLQVLAGQKVIQILRKEGVPERQLQEIKPPCEKSFGGIQVEFIETMHEGEKYADVQNLTLLVKKAGQGAIVEPNDAIEGKYLVITGDAAPTRQLFQRIGQWSKNIDWLFAPFPYVGLHSTRKLMKEALDISHIFVLHQPRQEADTQNWVANAKRVNENAKDGLPKAIFPEKLGGNYHI